MKLVQAVQKVFGQLATSLCQLQPGEYVQPSQALSGHTIGQHVRHIIELFQCLENGYEGGLVNYEKRKRDPAIEKDPELACRLLEQILANLSRPDRPLVLEASYEEDLPLVFSTNFYREIAYNLEHTIHHMALIRIGIRDTGSEQFLPESYGIASSTLQHRRECAQ
ncbi:MAG TPA: hypothetical protein VL832_15530 [Puia sp.]|jgi:hypothetical protein|nr:hypothetical protein [Puia sp.]